MPIPVEKISATEERGDNRHTHQVQDALEGIRSRLVNASLIAVCIFALPAVVAVLIRAADIGWHAENDLYVSAYLTLCGITFFRRQLAFRMRAWVLLGLWFAVGVTSLFMWGLAGNGIPFLITGCIFTTLLLGLRWGGTTIIATVAVMMGMWLGVDHWSAMRQAELAIYLSSNATWAVRISACSLMMAIIVASLGKLHHAMAGAYDEIRLRSADLEAVNRRLEKEIEDRRRAQQSLLESEGQLRSLYENIPVAYFERRRKAGFCPPTQHL